MLDGGRRPGTRLFVVVDQWFCCAAVPGRQTTRWNWPRGWRRCIVWGWGRHVAV